MNKAGVICWLIVLLILSVSCRNENEQRTREKSEETPRVPAEEFFSLLSPGNDAAFVRGDLIDIGIEAKNDSAMFDSALVFLGAAKKQVFKPGDEMQVNTSEVNPGNYRLGIRIFPRGKNPETHAVSIKILSDVKPDRYGYRLLKEYPHDRSAYTQGLEFHKGFLYEGTGNRGESSLRKVDLETGEILKYKNLSSDFFGEGITIINNKIYQITYRSQVGFVYDVNSFEQINKIYYQNREGWGLCNDGRNILMSDGSHIIYFMDTTYFSVEKKIEVFDDQGEVDLLNELELIDGTLYANRYTLEEIVMIDTATGIVEGRIDMSGLLKAEDRHPDVDYFNGIARDPVTDRTFVTGKYWPKLFQVEFVKIGE